MTKAECRKVFMEKRLSFSKEELAVFSEQIRFQLLENVNFSGKTISIFLPITSKREIDTFPILELQQHYNCRFILPVADFATNSMQHVVYENKEQLQLNEYGIPEPIDGESINSEEIDIVIVPLLCIDKKGYRVGYGKGFYDRFLGSCRTDCQFIGLSYFEPIDEISDKNSNDIALNACIFPFGMIAF